MTRRTMYPYQATTFSAKSYGGQGLCSLCHEGQAEYMSKPDGGIAYCVNCATEKTGSHFIKVGEQYFQGLYKPECKFSPSGKHAGRFSVASGKRHLAALRQRGYDANWA